MIVSDSTTPMSSLIKIDTDLKDSLIQIEARKDEWEKALRQGRSVIKHSGTKP